MKGFFDLESDYIEVKSHSDLVYQLFYAAKTNDVSNLKELLEVHFMMAGIYWYLKN